MCTPLPLLPRRFPAPAAHTGGPGARRAGNRQRARHSAKRGAGNKQRQAHLQIERTRGASPETSLMLPCTLLCIECGDGRNALSSPLASLFLWIWCLQVAEFALYYATELPLSCAVQMAVCEMHLPHLEFRRVGVRRRRGCGDGQKSRRIAGSCATRCPNGLLGLILLGLILLVLRRSCGPLSGRSLSFGRPQPHTCHR